jgi:hypothetical protein
MSARTVQRRLEVKKLASIEDDWNLNGIAAAPITSRTRGNGSGRPNLTRVSYSVEVLLSSDSEIDVDKRNKKKNWNCHPQRKPLKSLKMPVERRSSLPPLSLC